MVLIWRCSAHWKNSNKHEPTSLKCNHNHAEMLVTARLFALLKHSDQAFGFKCSAVSVECTEEDTLEASDAWIGWVRYCVCRVSLGMPLITRFQLWQNLVEQLIVPNDTFIWMCFMSSYIYHGIEQRICNLRGEENGVLQDRAKVRIMA